MKHRDAIALAILTLAGGSAAVSRANAQNSVPSTNATANSTTQDASILQAVIVTGTREQGRTVAESLSPIDVISSKDLAFTGAIDLGSALSRLLPSLDFPGSAINGPLSAVQPIIVRGLSPNYVLVLVDGKRYHSSAQVNYSTTTSRGAQAVDVASIPVAAVDHIEVLRDGAAAQYGSDAIAGVVNIILKHGSRRGENNLTVGGGDYSKGGGSQTDISGSQGISLGKDQQGWARISVNLLDAVPTNHAQIGDQSNPAVVAANGGFASQVYGSPGQRTAQALLNFSYDLTPKIKFYGYVDASFRNLQNYGYYRTANSSANILLVFPNGYLPQMPTRSKDYSALLGVKGLTDSGWRWDLSGVYGINSIANYVQNSINVALYQDTGNSPTSFYVGSWRDNQAVVDLDASKGVHLAFLPHRLTVALGTEWMRDQYQIAAGQPESYFADPAGKYPGGAQTFFGLTPAEAGTFSRDSQALYADLETSLTDNLSAGLAGRYEHYSDAGSAVSGKLSLRYQMTDSFALRGTVSNGFRAPSLGQEYYQTISTIINNNVLTQTGTFRTSNPVSIALGARPLKPETSTNFSVGAVWTPTKRLSLTADAYQIRIAHQILLTDSFSLAKNPALAAYVATVSSAQIGAAQYFANAATTRARGVDLVVSDLMSIGSYGSLNLSVSGNYNKTDLLNVAPTPNVLTQYAPGIDLYGRASQGLLTESTPRTKLVLHGTWVMGSWSVNGGLTRYGSVMRIGDTPAGDQKFASRWLLDTSVSYRYVNDTFVVGVDNLTNQYPTAVASNNTYDYFHNELPYSPLSPFGFNGRYLFANVIVNW